MKPATLQAFHHICYKIIELESNTGNLPFAKSYATVGLDLTTVEEVESQIPYIQYNLKEWKGIDARVLKLKLKDIHKEVKKELKKLWA